MQQIDAAVAILKRRGIIVFPTDTAYAVGGAFNDARVIERILQLKKRTNTRFTLIASSLAQAQEFFPSALQGVSLQLAQRYWPGPLSIVVNEHSAVRVPDHPIACQLAEKFSRPIIATSANLSGNPEHYDIAAAKKELGEEQVDAWIDGGALPKRPVSTIVKVVGEKIEVIRAGAIADPHI